VTDADLAADARLRAADAIAGGLAAEPRAAEADLRAVPIVGADGSAAGWFVGVVVGERLAGFVQLDAGLGFRRYASFAGREPAAADWLEPGRVREIAGAALRPGEVADEPVLGFDRSPVRVGWIVPVRTVEGGRRRLMVAGGPAFELGPGGGTG
jgi:hypothetical protein